MFSTIWMMLLKGRKIHNEAKFAEDSKSVISIVLETYKVERFIWRMKKISPFLAALPSHH
jgi:hypothetical protein